MTVKQDIRYLKHILGEKIMSHLADKDVMDIIVNSDGKLIVDKRGAGKEVVGNIVPDDILHAMNVLAQYRGEYLNEEHPECTVEMPNFSPYDGARAKCVIPPCSPKPSLTIRKHSDVIYPLNDFVKKDMLSEKQAAFLRNAIVDYKNIVVVGIPQSGKTSLARALINEIKSISNPKDRILVLEDVREIKVDMEDVEYMKTNPLSMQELVRNATRMRPDRIIVGEVTDSAAFDLMKAWNLGCSGGITTVHANSCSDAPQRLIDLACEKGIAPPVTLATTVMNIFVHMIKDHTHPYGRRVKEIAILSHYDREQQRFIVKPLKEKNDNDT